jgi:flagellin
MASDITLSASVRQNLLSLQTTADLMSTTQNRLATGKKVNSALDNPTNFFTSQSLNNRASDLNTLLDSIGQAQQTLKAADTAISSLTKLVQSAKSIAKQAQQSSAPATTYAQTITGTQAIAADTSSGGTTTNSTLSALAGQSLSITVGSGTAHTFNITATTTRADLETFLGGLNEDGITASINSSGNIVINSTSSSDITIGGTAATGLGLTAGTTSPTATIASPSATRTNFEEQYNDLLQQIDQLAKDASYNGINLLTGDDLKVVFNEDGSSSMTITGVDFSAQGLGLDPLAGGEFQTNNSIDAVLSKIDTALTTLRTQASKFGSNLSTVQTRQEFTKNMINTLQTGADALVLADTNEEGANLLALQTRQQLSTTALSLSAQADQAVLRLF